MNHKRRIDSREKGAKGELEFSRLILEHLNVKLVRNLEQTRGGGHDLVATGDDPVQATLNLFAFECKRYAAITPALLSKFWQQAESQARSVAKIPALAYRGDRQAWRVLVPLNSISEAFPETWEGYEWTAELSMEAFAALVRERAALPMAGWEIIRAAAESTNP